MKLQSPNNETLVEFRRFTAITIECARSLNRLYSHRKHKSIHVRFVPILAKVKTSTTMSHRQLRCGVSSPLHTVTARVLMLTIGIIVASDVSAQENAQTRIPASLAECYENAAIYERDNRLPATINTLIELIRKVEDSPGYTQDLRQVATSILHRFRLDGIEQAPGVFQQSVLPFSPSGYEFSKHRLLLSRLIPGNAFNFPNNTLTTVERVSHDMCQIFSYSSSKQKRNEEKN